MLEILLFTQLLGWLLYAGPMIALTTLFLYDRSAAETFQKWGVGFGLSLTLFVYSSIGLQYLKAGHFYPTFDEKPWLVPAFLMWISNIKLEIWTLDPIRKRKDKTESELSQAHTHLRNHLLVHSLLILVVQVLAAGVFSP